MITRRHALTLLAGAGALPALMSLPAFAEHLPGQAAASRAPTATSASPEDLADAGPLPEMAVGADDAPVTVYEYASMTCGHCARFHKDTWPLLKERYVDTGNVRFVMREFPLDRLAAAGFVLARCEPDLYWPVVDMLFEKQAEWAFVSAPVPPLRQLMAQAGFSQEKFDACLRNEELLSGIQAVREHGLRLGVEATPTFFINGEKYSGALTFDEFAAILDPML